MRHSEGKGEIKDAQHLLEKEVGGFRSIRKLPASLSLYGRQSSEKEVLHCVFPQAKFAGRRRRKKNVTFLIHDCLGDAIINR